MNVEATARLFALGTETGKRWERWCYIAGPMRSKPGFNYEAFNQAAQTLRDYGWRVFNPAETDAEVRDAAEASPNPLSVYMQQDLVDVCKSHVVFVLNGWTGSEGAKLEVMVARKLGVPVYAFPAIERIYGPVAPVPVHSLLTGEDFAADHSEPFRRVLDYVKPNGDPVVKRSGRFIFGDATEEAWDAAGRTERKTFDHEKGHLVDSLSSEAMASFAPLLKSGLALEYASDFAALQDKPVRPTVENMMEVTERLFSSGASRNPDTNKPDYEGFLSPVVIEAFGRYMHEHRKQGDSLRSSDNWQKGIPLPEYMKSLWRHFLHVWLLHRGHEALDPDTGEPVSLEDALCGVLFNTNGYLHEFLSKTL